MQTVILVYMYMEEHVYPQTYQVMGPGSSSMKIEMTIQGRSSYLNAKPL